MKAKDENEACEMAMKWKHEEEMKWQIINGGASSAASRHESARRAKSKIKWRGNGGVAASITSIAQWYNDNGGAARFGARWRGVINGGSGA